MVALVPPATGLVEAPRSWPLTVPVVWMIVNESPIATFATEPPRVAPPRLMLPVNWSRSLVGVLAPFRFTRKKLLPVSVVLVECSVPVPGVG